MAYLMMHHSLAIELLFVLSARYGSSRRKVPVDRSVALLMSLQGGGSFKAHQFTGPGWTLVTNDNCLLKRIVPLHNANREKPPLGQGYDIINDGK